MDRDVDPGRIGFTYSFDPEKHVRRPLRINAPIQEHQQLPRAKRQIQRSRRKTVPTARKNRPHKDIQRMNFHCCSEKTCLLNYGRALITHIRNDFDRKLYDQQNTYLCSLIEVEMKTKKQSIAYNIRDASGLRKVKVCKTAFLKIFGIGKKRVVVLLKKIRPYSGHVEEDKRRQNTNQKRIPLILKAEVVEHIRSYERDVSHYAREKTKDKQFLNSNLSIAEIWRQFKKKKKDVGVDFTLSYSLFRNIFRKFKLSFKKPYVDTCGLCDGYSVIIRYSKDDKEKDEAKTSKAKHIQQADEHYDCINYDLKTLPREKNNRIERAWVLPPIWK